MIKFFTLKPVKLKAFKIDTAKIMDTQAAQIQKKLQIELDSFKATQKGTKNEILRLILKPNVDKFINYIHRILKIRPTETIT